MRKNNCCSISLQCDLEAVSPGNVWTGERSSRDECAHPLQPWSRAAFLLRPQSPSRTGLLHVARQASVANQPFRPVALLTIAAGIFAGADAGELRPKIWERTEW
jgi:hypothetical protein